MLFDNFQATRLVSPPSFKVAVLIPAYNEEVGIEGTLQSLLRAGQRASDVYVVDDKSTDDTARLAERFAVNVATTPENGGKALAQQFALMHFRLLDRYDWVIMMDGDTKVDHNFIQVMRQAAAKTPSTALFLGQVMSTREDNIYSAGRAFDYAYGQAVAKQGQSNFGVVFVAPGCAAMFKTSFLRLIKVDAGTLAEDMDMTLQVHRLKGKVQYVPSAKVYTQDPGNLRDYFKQTLRWYRGYYQVIRKHKTLGLGGFGKKQAVDWYMAFLVLDSLVFNRATLGLTLGVTAPQALPHLFALDFLISLCVAIWASRATHRSDVITKFPAYYWLSWVNLYANVKACFETLILKKTTLAWNKVARF